MIEISRRWFVFGTAAALTAAALPSIPDFQPMPMSGASFLKREIIDFAVSFDANSGDQNLIMVELRVGDRLVYSMGMNVLSMFRWVACEGGEIMIRPSETFSFSTASSGSPPAGNINIFYRDYVDEGPPIIMAEQRTFPQHGPVILMPIHVDNSLEARIARRDAAPTEDSTDESFEDEWDEA